MQCNINSDHSNFRYSSDVFRLNLTDYNANIRKEFNVYATFAFLIHGFTDFYPGQVLIDGTGRRARFHRQCIEKIITNELFPRLDGT